MQFAIYLFKTMYDSLSNCCVLSHTPEFFCPGWALCLKYHFSPYAPSQHQFIFQDGESMSSLTEGFPGNELFFHPSFIMVLNWASVVLASQCWPCLWVLLFASLSSSPDMSLSRTAPVCPGITFNVSYAELFPLTYRGAWTDIAVYIR